MSTLLIAFLSFVAGVVAVVTFNAVMPEKVDKASKELNEELLKRGVNVAALSQDAVKALHVAKDDLRVEAARLSDLANQLIDAVKSIKKIGD